MPYIRPTLFSTGDNMKFFNMPLTVINFKKAPTHSSTTITVKEDRVL